MWAIRLLLRILLKLLDKKKRKPVGVILCLLATFAGSLRLVKAYELINFSHAYTLIENSTLGTLLLKLTSLVSQSPGTKEKPTVAPITLPQKTTPEQKYVWEPIKNLIASTPSRRLKAAKDLHINKGEYVLAFFAIDCDDCEIAAKKLNEKANLDKIVAFSTAPADEVLAWKIRLGLKYRVESISEDQFDAIGGIVFVPTLVLLKDGQAIGASEHTEVVN